VVLYFDDRERVDTAIAVISVIARSRGRFAAHRLTAVKTAGGRSSCATLTSFPAETSNRDDPEGGDPAPVNAAAQEQRLLCTSAGRSGEAAISAIGMQRSSNPRQQPGEAGGTTVSRAVTFVTAR
jgi:hypothetical protein